MRAILKRLLARPPRGGSPGRLGAERAAGIAERAAAEAGWPDTAGLASPVRTRAGLVWDVCQITRGSGWRIAVDDATGNAGAVGRWGIR